MVPGLQGQQNQFFFFFFFSSQDVRLFACCRVLAGIIGWRVLSACVTYCDK